MRFKLLMYIFPTRQKPALDLKSSPRFQVEKSGVFAFLEEVTVSCCMVMLRVGNQGTLEIRI